MRRQIVVLIAGSAVGCAGEPTAPEPSAPTSAVAAAVGAGSWVAVKQYPVDIFDATSVSITNQPGRTTVYVIGGFHKCCGAGQITDAVKAYDASANTWKPKARYPVPVQSTNGAAELGGKIYVSGGFTKRFENGSWWPRTIQSLYVYTPGTDSWERKRDIPITSVNGATVAYQGKLYVATGSIVWRYDPGTDQWSQFGARPERHWWDVSGGVIGGKFYLVEQYGGAVDILDLSTGAWTSGPRRPYRACSTASTTLQAKLYLFGWCDDYPTDPEARNRGLVFDPASGSWSDLAPLPVSSNAQATLARAFVNGKPRLSLVYGKRPNNHYLFAP